MDSPAYFFIAFTKVQISQTLTHLKKLKELAPTANVEAFTSTVDPLSVTYVATFEKPIDFPALAADFRAGKRILRFFHSTHKFPTYFYAVHLVHSLSPAQSLKGDIVAKGKSDITSLIPLIAPLHRDHLTPKQSSILVENPDRDIRKDDIANLNRTARKIPHSTFLATRTEE